MSDGITQWPGGNAGVSVAGAKVLVSPTGDGGPQRAHEVAQGILDIEAVTAPLRVEITSLKSENDTLRENVRLLQSAVKRGREVNESILSGRRSFFSEVLLAPVTPGDWTKEVWLLDPIKKFHGRGLRFKSLAEVHELHPELWVIGVTEDGVLLDAWGKS